MSKLTNEEILLIKKYEDCNDEEKSQYHEVIELDVIKNHREKFEVENLLFFGLLNDNKQKTYLVKD